MFLNPFMLLGIAAISVPILIHLLNRHKIQRVAWAAMRFLKVSIEKNQKRMRIEDLLLLILRCVILAMLALALARPVLRSALGGNLLGTGGVSAVLVIDNSLSMGDSDGVSTRFEQARQVAEKVLDSLPNGSSAALLLASNVVDPVIPEPTFDMNLLRNSIRQAPLTDRSTQLQPAFVRALEILDRRATGRREIYVITDAQAGGFEGLPDIQKRLEAAKDQIGTHVVIVGQKEERNLAVADLRFAGGIITADQAQRFEIKISNTGSVEARDVKVTLSIDSEAAADEATIDAIAAGEVKSVSLFARFRQAGLHSLQARLSKDRLPADDVRTIVVRAVESVSVLVLSADGRTDDREADAFFLQQALQPVVAQDRSTYFVRTTIRPATEASSLKWDDYDVVMFVDVPDLTNSAADALADFVKRGGGMVLFPGPKISADFYNAQLGTRLGLMPGTIGPAAGDAGQERKFFSLSAKDTDHPIVSIWADPAAGSLGAAHFYRAFSLSPIDKATAVMKWADGSPAALERDVDRGRVILFSSTAGTAWNDLPVRPGLFVPLIHRTIGRLIQRQDQGLNLGVGQRWFSRLPIDQLGRDVVFTLPTPDGQKQPPPRQTKRVELQKGLAVIAFDDIPFAGEYQAKAEGMELMRFAAQADSEESKLDTISDDQIKALSASANVIRWSPGVPLEQSLSAARSGSELWMPVIMLVIALAATETFLGNWFSESK